MTKIDKRINYKIVLDTETCPMDKDLEGVSAENMWVYDIGWAIVDKRGKVYKTRSFINYDIFVRERELMKSAYYADKLPKYQKDLDEKTRTLAKWDTIKRIFWEDLQEYDVKQVFAHNMRFDNVSLNRTQRWLTKSKYRYFFPYNIEVCDTLKMARDVIGKMPTYRRFCEEHGYMTNHKTPQPRFSAETLYRFISGNNDFVESHTGLEDVMIEKEILAYCYKQKKPMRRLLWKK